MDGNGWEQTGTDGNGVRNRVRNRVRNSVRKRMRNLVWNCGWNSRTGTERRVCER